MTRAVAVLLALLAIAVPLSLLAGRVWLDPASTPNAALILAELRLPRALLAVVVGAGLGAGGAAMQGYLRNPLADPGLFGIAPGAALGAVAALWFGYAASPWLLPAFRPLATGSAVAVTPRTPTTRRKKHSRIPTSSIPSLWWATCATNPSSSSMI